MVNLIKPKKYDLKQVCITAHLNAQAGAGCTRNRGIGSVLLALLIALNLFLGFRLEVKAAETEGVYSRGDSRILAVRKRFFAKKRRHEFTIYSGIIPNDAFIRHATFGGQYTYHFSERLGLQLVNGAYAVSWQTEDYKRLQQFQPVVNPTKSFGTVDLILTPVYGKMNFGSLNVLYFDLYVLGGAGLIQTQNKTFPTLDIGLGQRWYISKQSALRFEVRGYFYNDDTLVDPNNVIVNNNTSSFRYNLNIGLGLSFFLPKR